MCCVGFERLYLLFYIIFVFRGNEKVFFFVDELLVFLESVGIIDWFVFGVLGVFYWNVIEGIEKLVGKWCLKKIGIS